MMKFLTIALVLPLLLLGYSGDDDSTDVSPPNGIVDELRLAWSAQPSTLDPAQANLTIDLAVVRQLYRGLLSYDEKLNLVPLAAKEIPTEKNGGVSADGLVYTFELRDGMKWSDGKNVTASDFEYAIKRLLDPATDAAQSTSFYDIRGAEAFNTCLECEPSRLAQLRADVGVKAIDEETVRFTLNSRRNTFPYLLALVAASPLREDVVESSTSDAFALENLVTNGPFVLKEWIPNEMLVLEPSQNWELTKVHLKKVTLRIIPDETQAYNAYNAMEIDAVVIPPELKSDVDNNPEKRRQNVKLRPLQSWAVFLNTTKAPFDNALVRQAFSLAIDRQAFVDQLQTGQAEVGYSWLPPAMPGYDKNLGRNWSFDAAKAKKLLSEAGYPEGRGLPPITYAYPTRNGVSVGPNQQWAEFLQSQFRENLGVAIQLKPQEITEWRVEFRARSLQIFFADWTTEYPDPEGMLQEVWTCQGYDAGRCTSYSGFNLSQYANSNFDSEMQKAAKNPDVRRRVSIYKDAQEILVADAPAVFISHSVRNLLVQPYVVGTHTPMDNLPFEYFLDRVSIKG